MLKKPGKKLICDFPKASSAVETPSSSCLKKFIVNFRRPDNIKQKNNVPYDCEYGFDWLRDEYIYPIEMVYNRFGVNLGKYVPVCLEPLRIRQEYLKDVKNPIKPYKKDYYPAWLSIFACGVKSNAASNMHSKGVDLNLQLDEIDVIHNDETEIILESNNPFLKIKPKTIPISEFLKTKRKTRYLNEFGSAKINYYELENAVNVICHGGLLKEHEEIKVFAKLGQCKVEVGKLMVYKNSHVPKMKIGIIDVITERDDEGNKIRPIDQFISLSNLLKRHAFNQALIQPEIIVQELDLLALKNQQDEYVEGFFKQIEDRKFMNGDYDKLLGFSVVKGLLIQLNLLYDNEISKINNSEQQTNTPNFYEHKDIIPAFLTTLKPYNGVLNGLTSFDKNKNLILENKVYPSKPSNNADIIFFKHALNKSHTIIHELGHALYLEHIFDTEEAKPGVLRTFSWFNVDFPITNALIQPKHYTFYQGYTDNAMDYTYQFKNMKDENNKLNFEEVPSKFEKQMNSFYKWQWDIMRAYPFLVNE